MIRLHLLTPGYRSANSQALLHPLLAHRRVLAEAGLAVEVFTRPGDQFADADVAAIDSKVFARAWDGEARSHSLTLLERWRRRAGGLVWIDTGDSTALMQPWVLPLVGRYLKSQLLRDRAAYARPHYGQRLYTDDAHRRAGVVDAVPASSQPVGEPALLARLGLFWNSGLADHSLLAPWRARAYRALRIGGLLAYPRRFADARAPRDVAINARMKAEYARATVSHMRRAVLAACPDAASGRLSRRAYLAELARSRLVLSPFGWGEINLRDYESFIAGAALLKPDMSHLETWPDLFRDGETVLSHRWDLADLAAVIEGALADRQRTADIAARGQTVYRDAIAGRAAAAAFAQHAIAVFTPTAPAPVAAGPAVRAASAATAPC
ncbi:MAG: glycosyltransferase [Alphaproteobacteria bacterium]